MRIHKVLSDILKEIAEESQKTKCGITFFKEHHTKKVIYYELLHSALSVGNVLKNNEAAKGTYIILQLKDPEYFIKCFWGAVMIGAIPVPLTLNNEKGLDTEKLKNILPFFKQYMIITERKYLDELKYQLNSENRIYPAEDFLWGNTHTIPAIVHEHETAYVQFSSGSTSSPKGVCLSHHNLTFNIEAMLLRCGGKQNLKNEKIIGWLPLTHNMGLIGTHLMPLFAGIDQYIITPLYLVRNTAYIMKVIKEERISFMICPSFVMRLFLLQLDKSDRIELDFSSVRSVLVGGESVNPNLVRKFVRKFQTYGLKPNTIACGYGMAEATLIVAFQHMGEGLKVFMKDNKENVVNGTALEGIEIYTVDEHGTRLDYGQTGEIAIEAESVMMGYLGIDSTKVLKGGKLLSGDIGIITKDGSVAVLGRKKDLIIIHAKNFYAQDLERKMEETTNISSDYFAIISVMDDKNNEAVELYIVEELIKNNPSAPESLEKSFETYTGHILNQIYKIKTIPKTVSGKKQRYQLPHITDRKKINELSEKKFQNPESILEFKIADIWKRVLNRDIDDIHTSFFKYGGDSLTVFECIGLMKKEKISISPEFFFSHPTIAELSKQAQKGKISLLSEQEILTGYVNPLPFHYYLLDENYVNHWNFSVMLDISPMLSSAALIKIISKLLEQNDGLRHRIHIENNNITEWIASVQDSLSVIWDNYKNKEELERKAADYQETLDIETCPFKIIAFALENTNKGKILFLIHHILGDAYSMKKLAQNFLEIYEKVEVEKKDYTLKEKGTSVRQWGNIVSQFANTKECRKDLEYWKEMSSIKLNIPFDYKWKEEDNIIANERIYSFAICKVNELPEITDLQYKLMASFCKTICEWTKQDKAGFSYIMNGRYGIETDIPYNLTETIGWIANIVPLKFDAGKDIPFDILVKNIKYEIKTMPHNGLSYNCLKYFDKDEVLVKNGLPVITFNYYDVKTETVLYRKSGCQISKAAEKIGNLEHPDKRRNRILDFVLHRADNKKLTANIHYNVKLHKQDTIIKFAEKFLRNIKY